MLETDVSLGQGLSLIKCLYRARYNQARSWLTAMHATVQIFNNNNNNNSSAVNLILLLIFTSVFLTLTADFCNSKGFRFKFCSLLDSTISITSALKILIQILSFVLCVKWRMRCPMFWGRWDKYPADILAHRWNWSASDMFKVSASTPTAQLGCKKICLTGSVMSCSLKTFYWIQCVFSLLHWLECLLSREA